MATNPTLLNDLKSISQTIKVTKKEVHADPTANRYSVGQGSPKSCRILKFVVGSFELHDIFLREGSILDP
jgi:hypothetical protein